MLGQWPLPLKVALCNLRRTSHILNNIEYKLATGSLPASALHAVDEYAGKHHELRAL